jgi:hypothetical protein
MQKIPFSGNYGVAKLLARLAARRIILNSAFLVRSHMNKYKNETVNVTFLLMQKK